MNNRPEESEKKRIAVVGAGIYGISCALELDSAGFSVDLFEREEEILRGASGANQLRLHRGYHYPRSKETISSCKRSVDLFEEKYKDAVVSVNEGFYCIASENSHLTPQEYLNVCDECDLKYGDSDLDFIDKKYISKVIKVEENTLDIEVLREMLLKQMKESNINLLLNTSVTDEIMDNYDLVVVAGYSKINDFFVKNKQYRQKYQFKLCEKPVVKLPKEFNNKSIVVLDGPFFCIDPYGNTDNFILGNVTEAVHTEYIGEVFEIPEEFKDIMNKGLIKNPKITNFKKFIKNAKDYMPAIEQAEHIGSFFTVRTVLPNKEKTDERPTIVKKVAPNVVTIFAGKISSCITSSKEVLKIAEKL